MTIVSLSWYPMLEVMVPTGPEAGMRRNVRSKSGHMRTLALTIDYEESVVTSVLCSLGWDFVTNTAGYSEIL